MPDHPVHPDIDLLDGEMYARDPHPVFRWMRENAPVYYDEKRRVWGVTLHEDVMRVSKDSQTFCNGQGMRPDSPPIPSMINMDAPQHLRRRSLVSRGFTPRGIQDQEGKVRSICVDLVEKARAKGSFDFVKDVAAPLPMIMIGGMLGVEPEDHEMLLRWSDALILGTSATATPEAAAGAQRAFTEYSAYNQRVVADRRAKPPQDDLMSVLVYAEIDGEGLSDEALLQESLLILVGGDETTRHVISGGMYQLMTNPQERQKLVEDPSKIKSGVEEMLRWVTPIQNMARTVTRDVELRGQQMKEGDKVLLLYPAANRDERVFADPDRFDVERKPNNHVAFGGYGAHFCLGSVLARLELNVMFEEILRHMPTLELATDQALPRRPSNFITGFEAMPVRVA